MLHDTLGLLGNQQQTSHAKNLLLSTLHDVVQVEFFDSLVALRGLFMNQWDVSFILRR
jgi:hypothetical protein